MIRERRFIKYFAKPLCVLLVVTGVFSLVLLRSSIKSLEYKLGILQLNEKNLIKEHRNLLAEKEVLLSVNNIDEVAFDKMGLQFQDRKKVIFVEEKEMPKAFLINYRKE